ncbi:bifunctional nuclease family protein [archaeon]|nr:bifunctional nuclease family protein [archaeon]
MKEIYKPFIIIISILVILAIILTLGQTYNYCNYNAQPFLPTFSNTTDTGTFGISNSGFVTANITLDGVRVVLTNNCHEIGFDVTNDQAYSIRNGLDGTMTVRPLTHDILRDIVEGFNITILNMRIEKFDNDIYYARVFIQQGSKIIDMDIRPSDAIALSLRTKNTLYINETMLKEKGTVVC